MSRLSLARDQRSVVTYADMSSGTGAPGGARRREAAHDMSFGRVVRVTGDFRETNLGKYERVDSPRQVLDRLMYRATFKQMSGPMVSGAYKMRSRLVDGGIEFWLEEDSDETSQG